MTSFVAAVAALAYASLLLELTVLHVPSVASSSRIWAPRPGDTTAYSPRYRRLLRSSKLWKLLVSLPLVFVYAVFLYPIALIATGEDLLGDFLFQPVLLTNALAAALMLSGRVVSLTAALTLRRYVSSDNSIGLHTGGVFRWSRNPGLVGMYSFALGLWLAAPSLSLLCAILVYIAYMHFKVRMEEDYLQMRFGDAYAQYSRRTRRYLS